MSLLPLLMNLNWDRYDPYELQHHKRPRSDWDSFGLGITPQEIQVLSSLPSSRKSLQLRDSHDLRLGQGEPHVGKDGFQVILEVQQFHPNEITVKTVDNTIIVEGKHEERHDDQGSISRQFVRKYHLPKGYELKEIVSTLSSDGVLIIKVAPPEKSVVGTERVIQIQQTGPAHLNIKDNPAVDSEEKSKSSSSTKKN